MAQRKVNILMQVNSEDRGLQLDITIVLVQVRVHAGVCHMC